MKYVLIKKLCELTGYTEDAIRAKVKKGQWRRGVHYVKAPDGRIHYSPGNIEKWVEGKAV